MGKISEFMAVTATGFSSVAYVCPFLSQKYNFVIISLRSKQSVYCYSDFKTVNDLFSD